MALAEGRRSLRSAASPSGVVFPICCSGVMSTAATYPTVWLSSDRQLAALTDAYGSASLLQKLSGRFAFPDGTSYISNRIMWWMRCPLAFEAHGELRLDRGALSFRSRPPAIYGHRFFLSLPELGFELRADRVLAVEPADFASPVARLFNLPFTRLRTREPAPLDDFLLAVGGKWSIRRIRAESLQLRQQLQAWAKAR